MRPLDIRSRYDVMDCPGCDAEIEIEWLDDQNAKAYRIISGPEDHNDDCPAVHRAYNMGRD